MILFEVIRYKNFLSTGNVFTEIQLNRHHNTLILGTNGAGKSTLLDALTFVLFGKSFRGINLPNLVNSINENGLLVELEFTIGTKRYKVERGIKPAIFNIYCNGVLQSQDARSTDYQKLFETQILKFNYKAFTQIVILGSSSFVPFMQLPALDRRAIIEDLLDIEIFSSMNAIVKSTLKDIIAELDSSKIKLDSTLSKIELQKKYVDEAKKNNTSAIEDAREAYSQQEIQVNKFLADAALIQQHIDVLSKTVLDAMDVCNKESKLRTFEHKISIRIKNTEKHLKFYTDTDKCPTCEQALETEFKNNGIRTASEKLEEYRAGLQELLKQQEKVKERVTEIIATNMKINSHQNELTRINASVVQIQKRMGYILEEIKKLENKKVLSDDMLEVSRKLMQDLAELTERRKELSESKKYYEIAATLLKDNGIKTKIIRQYLPVINKLINKYLAAMDSFFNFEINEEFKETIKSRHRDDFKYENFSEGEKMRIDLALLFTWRAIAKLKNSMNTNLLILDEVFDSSLDNNGTEEFMRLLNSLGSDTNVFVISHKGDILIDKFKSTIRFSKVKNFSLIET